MNGEELTVEELRDYCAQLCCEGKGGDAVKLRLWKEQNPNCDYDVDSVEYDDGHLRVFLNEDITDLLDFMPTSRVKDIIFNLGDFYEIEQWAFENYLQDISDEEKGNYAKQWIQELL